MSTENHSKHHSHVRLYIKVFVALTVLTVVELIIPELKNISTFAKGSSLTGLALAKAFLVAYYFMHLNEETRWLKYIASAPIFAFVYAVMVIVESVVR